jgi:hypothetical protein
MVTSVAITVVGSIIIYALAAGITTYAASRDREDDFAPMRIAAVRIARDLREIRSPGAVISAAPDRLTYRDTADREVTYQFAGGTLRRNGRTLLSDIAGFEFIYRGRAGERIVPPAVEPNFADLGAVGIQMTAHAGGMKETIETTVCPRMLRE